MPFQVMLINHLDGDMAPAVNMYFSDPKQYEEALATISPEMRGKIFSGTSNAPDTKGMSYITFPIDGVSTEAALEFIKNEKPFPQELSPQFIQNINAISDQVSRANYSSPEVAMAASKAHPENIIAAKEIFALQVFVHENRAEIQEQLKLAGLVASHVNGASDQELKQQKFADKRIEVFNNARQLDGVDNKLSPQELVAYDLTQELFAFEKRDKATPEDVMPIAKAAYKEIISVIPAPEGEEVDSPRHGLDGAPGNRSRAQSTGSRIT